MDPISPELVLVSPELREVAFAAQTELPWEVAFARAQLQARATPAEPADIGALHAAASVVGRLVQLAVFVAFATGAITLALTLIANATATR
jgi:uncharacterized protein HemY